MLLSLFVVASAAAVAPEATAPAKADADPVICANRWRSEVGTHMRPKKVCMRQSDWDLVEENTKETLQTINQRGNNPGMADGHRPQ
jgi:hypothetical protein